MSSIEKLEKMQERVLRRLEGELKNASVAAVIREKGEHIPSIVLTALFPESGANMDELLGEYTFLPMRDEDQVQIFSSILTFTEELPGDYLDELYQAVSKLNFYLPYGCMGVDMEEKRLGFKLGMPMSIDLNEEQLYEQVNIFITGSYLIADQYIDFLLEISRGEAKADELLELL